AAVGAATCARDESGGREMGYGSETEAAQLDGNFVERAQQAASALAGIRQPLIKLGLRLEAIAEDAPDWLDAQGRARIEGARHSLAWRIDTLAAWEALLERDRKSTRLNSSHVKISYAVFCLKKKNKTRHRDYES